MPSATEILVILLCVGHCVSDQKDYTATDKIFTGTTCSNNSENGQCETITPFIADENVTALNSSQSTIEVDVNSSITSSIDDSKNISTESSSTLMFTSTSTSFPPTTSKVIPEPSDAMHFVPEDICLCDLTVGYCDINCCCDEDCTASDRQVFSHCFKRRTTSPDLRYCYQTNFMYRNNTELKMVQNADGLFCIMWDNVPLQSRYLKRKVVSNLLDFKKMYSKRQTYSWQTDILKKHVFQPEPYKAGSTLWIISNTSLAPLALPNKQMTAFCETSVNIKYLVDWIGSCSLLNLDCKGKNGLSALTYYSTFYVVATPQYLNASQISYFMEQQDCMYNICLPFDLFDCSSVSNIDDCLPVNDIESSLYNNETEECVNVVKKLKYRFYHNGTIGITKAEAYFWMISTKPTQSDVRQEFSVEFVWVDSPVKPFQRSGNPGYIVGKPVIAGRKVFHMPDSDDEPEKEAILLSDEQSKWLTLPKPGKDSLCINNMAEGNRTSINFGENMLTSCFIEFSISSFLSRENCSSLQRKILVALLGDVMINVTDSKQLNLYVSTFGDGNVEETGDWVPVLIENMPIMSIDRKSDGVTFICRGVVTIMHINIVTSKVGLASNPQSKILGVAISFDHGQDLVFDCSPKFCSGYNASKTQKFELRSSVSFLDVSKSPVIHFAEPPVYEVKLPYDFFYPFLSSCSTTFTSLFVLYFLSIMCYIF